MPSPNRKFPFVGSNASSSTPLSRCGQSLLCTRSRLLVLTLGRLQLEPTSLSGVAYGSHHALYRLNGTLIAFAVLDLLPQAVSSVYFVWNPDWSGMSLGKLSALREIEMVRDFERRGLWEAGKGRYMMGE